MIISSILKPSCLIQRGSFTTSLSKTFTRWNHSNGSTIANEDVIHRVDLRVGKIVQIENHSEASHLFIEQGKGPFQNPFVAVSLILSFFFLVDLKTESTDTMPNPRTIVSGLAPYMTKESLLVSFQLGYITIARLFNICI